MKKKMFILCAKCFKSGYFIQEASKNMIVNEHYAMVEKTNKIKKYLF